jgi:hypothetical protein
MNESEPGASVRPGLLLDTGQLIDEITPALERVNAARRAHCQGLTKYGILGLKAGEMSENASTVVWDARHSRKIHWVGQRIVCAIVFRGVAQSASAQRSGR